MEKQEADDVEEQEKQECKMRNSSGRARPGEVAEVGGTTGWGGHLGENIA